MSQQATFESVMLHDVDQLDSASKDWKIKSLQLQPGRHRFAADRIVFPDLMVEHYRCNTAKQDLYELPADTTLITVFRKGIPSGHWCGYSIADNVALINQCGREHFAVMPSQHEGVAMLIDNDLLSQWQLLPESVYLTRRISRHQIISLRNDASLDFRDRLFNAFDSTRARMSLTEDSLAVDMFREQLLCDLKLMLRRGVQSDEDVRRSPNFNRRYELVRQACCIARERVVEDMNTRWLADQVGVSVRALQRGFVDVLGISPSSYLLHCKLHAIRRELRGPLPPGSTVSSVALKFGITELGRFSGRYRQLFGELPSTTLRQGRG